MRTRASIRCLALAAATIVALLAGTVSATAAPAGHHPARPYLPAGYRMIHEPRRIAASAGSVCDSGDSSTGQEGTICIGLDYDNGGKTFWANAHFIADTNRLDSVCVNHLHLYVNSDVLETIDDDCIDRQGDTTGDINTNERTFDSPVTAWAGVYAPCMYFEDSSHWCPHSGNWWYSDHVTMP